jgi:hypothetical protein
MTEIQEIDLEDRYEELSSRYQDAVQECYDEVLTALEDTNKPQPDVEDLYSELDDPKRSRKYFARAGIAMADMRVLELWDEDVGSTNYRFQMSEMDEEHLEEVEEELKEIL